MPATGIVPVIPNIMPNNGDITSSVVPLQSPAVGSTIPMPTSPTGPPPPFPPISSSSNLPSAAATSPITTTATVTPLPSTQRTIHNDLNDAQNISKILQSSIHNGNNTSTISTTSNHHADEVVVTNHKESSSNEKLQSKSKKKSPQSKTTPPSKKNEKVHTNGLVSSDKKVKNSKNNLSVTNGNEDEVDDELLEKIKEENMETRTLAFREIRRLGRDYSGLYEQLAKVKGSFEMRFSFIQMCIDEAVRFRRKHMADCIQEWWSFQCDEDNVVVEKKSNNSSARKKRSTT